MESQNQKELSSDHANLNIKRASYSHKQCVFKWVNKINTLQLLTKEECLEIYVKMNVYVKYGSRVCNCHGPGKSLLILDDFQAHAIGVCLTSEEVISKLETFKKMVLAERSATETIFFFLNMKTETPLFETNLTHDQFSTILTTPDSTEINVRSKKEVALAVYLSRLRRGYTYDELTVLTTQIYAEMLLLGLYVESTYHFVIVEVRLKPIVTHQPNFHATSNDRIIMVFDGTYTYFYSKKLQLPIPKDDLFYP